MRSFDIHDRGDIQQASEASALRALLSPPFAFIQGWDRGRHVSPYLFITQLFLPGGIGRTLFYNKAGKSHCDQKCDYQYDATGQTCHSILHRRTDAKKYVCYDDFGDSPSIHPRMAI